MRGWLAALLEWAVGGESAFEQQTLLIEFVTELRVADLQDYVRQREEDILRGRDYPRLRAWLENQATTVNFTPWAIFRD